jgi:hypothetical protein
MQALFQALERIAPAVPPSPLAATPRNRAGKAARSFRWKPRESPPRPPTASPCVSLGRGQRSRVWGRPRAEPTGRRHIFICGSNILKSFNDQFGTLFTDGDRIIKRIRDDVAPKVAADEAFQNAKRNTPGAAKIEHDKALARVMLELLKDDTDVYKQFVQNESFKKFISDMVYQMSSA